MLQSMGSQRVRNDWVTELNWQLFVIIPYNIFLWFQLLLLLLFLILIIWNLSLFMMNLKSLFNLWWIRPMVYQLFYIFREWDLRLLIFSILLVSISFISAPIFMVSFLQLTLGFVCSSCSSFLRCKVMLLEIFFSEIGRASCRERV